MYDFYNTSAQMLKDSADDPSLVRKSACGYSCASCSKDVSNLYMHMSRTQDHASWNKLPAHDSLVSKVSR